MVGRRHLLEAKGLTRQIFDTINAHLAAELPVLAEVGGALRLEVGNTGKLPRLAFVGGGIMIMGDIELPMLTVLYGEVFVMRTATLRISWLKVGSVDTKLKC